LIARRLRPEALDDLGLTSALAALTNEFVRAGHLRVERRIARSLPPLHRDAELVVYRVAQEALTNVLRHAGCDDARLTLRAIEGAVELEIFDAGSGFDADDVREGAGIRGMRERALLAGAALNIQSSRGVGTLVRLRVPA
jgi:two-component system sensor histidine kinase UhpB